MTNIDMSKAPRWALGSRDPVWWGVALLLCIEGTMLALMLMTILYLRGDSEVWPPTGPGHAAFAASLVGMILLLVSVVPMVLCSKAAARNELRRARTLLIIATVLGLGFVVCRVLEWQWIVFRWDDHAYGSCFWTTIGLHSVHGISSSVENLLFIALLFSGKVQNKHRTDLQTNALYWYFVVFAYVPLWAVLYLGSLR